MGFLRLLLFPFAVIYDGVTRFRNRMYDMGQKRTVQFDRTVICVGNLNVGGSGKTPMVEYLVRLLNGKYKVAILSRGYGRRTRGLRMATAADSATTLGDEPYQYYRKFADEVSVTVAEERALAIPEIILNEPETDVVVLDDAYQHRSVTPQLSILLTEYSSPFYRDFLLPAGRLREARVGAVRADIVVVTKCSPVISKEVKEEMVDAIRRYAPRQPVYFSRISYDQAVLFSGAGMQDLRQVVLVSGIARSDVFEKDMRSRYEIMHHFDFSDHHRYTADDIRQIKTLCHEESWPVITTEKDMVKLIAFQEELAPLSWFYIPVRMILDENGAEFDSFILNEVSKQS